MKSLTRYFLIAFLAFASTPAFSQVSVSVGIAPPPLVVYSQPPCPDDGYVWTPGYWAYSPDGYYWVPGCWVQPPEVGVYWTPGYWGWGGNDYFFHSGYWGDRVGFYGGVNYGYGYNGNGYGGGRWQGRHFYYNTAVNNVGSGNFHYRYDDRTVINNNNSRNVSYNGGNGGIQAQSTAQERQYASERHIQSTSLQQAHVRAASQDRAQLASVNGGRPATTVAATPKAYQRVAQQHAKRQPLTGQDRVQAQRVTSTTNTRVTASNHPLAQTHVANSTTHPAETHNMASVRPAQTHVPSHAETHAVSHPQVHAASHPHAQTQSHAQSHVQSHAQAPAPSHAAQGHSAKPQAHR